MLCSIVSLGVGRPFINSLITTILVSRLFCVFMLSASSSPLSSFPPPYLLCLQSCRQSDLRQAGPPAAYSPSFSTAPAAGCFFLFSPLQPSGPTRRTTIRNPSWVCVALVELEHGKSGPPITAHAVQMFSCTPVNTKGTLPSICRYYAFCFSPVTQSLTMP